MWQTGRVGEIFQWKTDNYFGSSNSWYRKWWWESDQFFLAITAKSLGDLFLFILSSSKYIHFFFFCCWYNIMYLGTSTHLRIITETKLTCLNEVNYMLCIQNSWRLFSPSLSINSCRLVAIGRWWNIHLDHIAI